MTREPMFRLALILILSAGLAACDDARSTAGGGDSMAGSGRDGGPGPAGGAPSRTPSRDAGAIARQTPPLDFGEDWEDAPVPGGGSGLGGDGTPARSVWGIVLMSFTDDGHEYAAATMLGELPRLSSEVAARAWSHTGERGSMVVYGKYTSPRDEDARRDLTWIRSLNRNNVPIFRRAMIGRIIEGQPESRSPYSLRRVREMYPGLARLYTLEVAVWGVFDSSNLSLEHVQRQAEAYCQELRARRHEAYFHHNVDKQISMVTVGLFGRDALDPEANLFSPEVEAVMAHFPSRLVNGEPFNEPVDVNRPSRGTRPQRPRLVVVP